MTEIYWEEFYSTDGANRNPIENQNCPESESRMIQNHPIKSQSEEVEMKIYEDVGNSEELEEA
jgi:hypothetical protein